MPLFEEGQDPLTQDAPLSPFRAPLGVDRPQVPEFKPDFMTETVPAAFRQNNWIYGAMSLLGDRPENKFDPEHNPLETIKGTWAEQHPEMFLSSPNEATTRDMLARGEQENKDRQTLAGAGWPGVAAAVGAGLVDPTVFIPFVGLGGGVIRSAATTAALGVLQAGVSEGALYASQVTRTPEEALQGVASAAVLSGVLGGALGMLTPAERAAAEKGFDEMRRPVLDGVPEASLSAAEADTRQLKQIGTGPVDRLSRNFSPIARVMGGESVEARRLLNELVAVTRRTEGEAAGEVKSLYGGAIETVNNMESAKLGWRNLEILTDSWKQHYYEGANAPVLAKGRAAFDSWRGATPAGKLDFNDFKEAVFDAMYSGDQSQVPEVANAARQIRSEILEPLAERAKNTKREDGTPLLDPDVAQPNGDASFISRLWNHSAIISDMPRFKGVITKWLGDEQVKKAAAKERLAALNEKHTHLDDHVEKLQGRIDTIESKMQETATRLDERAQEAKQAVPREEALQARAGDIRDAISEVEEFIGAMRGELKDPQSLERLNDLQNEVRALRGEAKPISAAELARLEKQEVGEAFYGAARKAAEIAIGKRKLPDIPSFTAWLAREGGISGADGELKAILGGKKMPGLIRTQRDLIGKTGRGLDDWGEKLANDFPEAFPEGRPSPDEVLSFIRDAEAGHPPSWWAGEDRLRLEQDAENFRDLFNELGISPKNLREAAEGIRGGDPLILQRLQEKAEAARQLPHAEAALAGRQEERSAVSDLIDRALANRRGREAALSREGARAQEAGVAASRTKGRIRLLEDRAARQELMQDMLANAKQFAEKMRDDVRGDIEAEIKNWKGKSSAEAISAIASRDTAQAAAERDAVMGRRAEPGRMGSADKPVDRAVRRMLESEQDYTPDELGSRAQQIIDRILGTPDGRFAYDEATMTGPMVKGDERGSLHSRDFAIPTALVRDFVERDMEHVITSHLRTMLPDIELTRRFGDVNMESSMKKIMEEYNSKIAAATSEKERVRLRNAMDADIADIAAMRDKIRNVYGFTGDLSGRNAQNIARDLRNVTSMASLGGAAINSFTDFGVQAVFRHGLMNVFHDQWAPFVKSLAGAEIGKVAKRQAREAGIGVETALGLARNRFEDIVSNARPGNAFSRGLSYGADRFHLVNGLGPWTDMAKTWAFVPAQAEFGRVAKRIAAGKGTKADIAKMADASIPIPMARKIAALIDKHGQDVDGVRFANAGAWEDAEARRVFETAMHREVDILVTTPGHGDKALWVSSPVGSVIGQFKSFMMGAHERVMMANLQQRDARTVQGVITALGMGAVSYGMYSLASGRPPSDRPQDWAKEAIDRASLMGWFGEINKVGAKWSGGRADVFRMIGADRPLTRRSNNSKLAELAGPSFSLFEGGLGAASHAVEGQFNAADLHHLRRILPGQNLWAFRRLLDQVEHGTANTLGLPATRNQNPTWEP